MIPSPTNLKALPHAWPHPFACAVYMRTQGEQAQALRFLCQGYAWLALGLDLSDALPRHAEAFNTPRQRFEQRFAFCHRLPAPEPLAYDKLVDALNSAGAARLLLLFQIHRYVLAVCVNHA